MVLATASSTGGGSGGGGSGGNGSLAWRLGVDLSILAGLVGVIVYYAFFGVTRKRGFFCDDPDLSHPYLESTVSSAALYAPATLVPFFVVCLTEFVRARRFGLGWKSFLADAYVHFLVWFGFGAVVTQTVTYVIKFYAARLRPHFFAVCQPDFAALAPLCSAGAYVTDYNCTNRDFPADVRREAFISFPSGHASFGFHSATFLVFYLRERWDRNIGGVVVRPFVQLAFLVAAFMVCISRVNDFKHFPSDVTAGGILGIAVAVFVYCALDLADLRSCYIWGEGGSGGGGTGGPFETQPGARRGGYGAGGIRGGGKDKFRDGGGAGEHERRRRGFSGLHGQRPGNYKTFDNCTDSLRAADDDGFQ